MEQVTGETYQHDVVEASYELPVMVDFWGPSCGPCLKMMPLVEQLAAEHANKVKVVKLNTSEHRRLSLDLGVMGLPTMMLYRDGKVAVRLTADECTPSMIRRTFSELAAT